MQRTCVGWPARSVRSLRYHGTVLCLADSAPNFTANRSLVAPPPSGICYFAPNICSSLPWWRLPLSGGQKGQLELGEGFKVSEMPREVPIPDSSICKRYFPSPQTKAAVVDCEPGAERSRQTHRGERRARQHPPASLSASRQGEVMTDNGPTNLVLRYLRDIDGKLDRLQVGVNDLQSRVTVNSRLDRFEARLDQIERRLGLCKASS